MNIEEAMNALHETAASLESEIADIPHRVDAIKREGSALKRQHQAVLDALEILRKLDDE